MNNNDIRPWMRHAEKEDMTLSKGILAFFVITVILFACIYFAS